MLCLQNVRTWNGMGVECFYMYILDIYHLKRFLILHHKIHKMDLEELDEKCLSSY